MGRLLKDSKGNELPIERVRDLAFGNIEASLSRKDLVHAFIDDLTDYDLIEWAEDENGEFVDE